MAEHTLFEDIQESMKKNRQSNELMDHLPLDGFTPVDPAALGVEDYVSGVVRRIQDEKSRQDRVSAQPYVEEQPAAAAQELPSLPEKPKAPSLDDLEKLPDPEEEPEQSLPETEPLPTRPLTSEPEEEEAEPSPVTVYDLDLTRAKYNEAVNREYYLMQQAGRIQTMAAVFLAIGGAALSICFNRSQPGFFVFYLSACICPLSLAVVLAMAFQTARLPSANSELNQSKGLTEEALCRIYMDLQERIAFTNSQRSRDIRRNLWALALSLLLGFVFIVTGIGIGA